MGDRLHLPAFWNNLNSMDRLLCVAIRLDAHGTRHHARAGGRRREAGPLENAGAGGVPAAAADVRQVNELARAGALVEGLKIGR
jgi:hypothetical protein